MTSAFRDLLDRHADMKLTFEKGRLVMRDDLQGALPTVE